MVNISEIEEGSSSSSHNNNNNNNNKRYRYDVFISFRGADTRLGFTDHLYNALVNADINTFLDDEEIETGEDLKPGLEDAIRSSRASVIVLSKNYATSTWCLDELALILDQRHIVIPIFYHVEPSDVRWQENSFGDAMKKHREKMEAETNPEKRVRWDRWSKALTEVADLKGKDVKNRKETEFIEEIVSEIREKLGVPLIDTLPRLIGRDIQIWKITSWLTDGSSSHTADILTVFGMGGIGKTYLAKYVFHLHSRTFDKSCFIEGINLRCTGKFNGLLDVQKQLYGDISKNKKQLVHDIWVYTSMIEKALDRVKVFLVLDDIDSLGQLDALLGNKGFHPGSKIIITTKDASLTERCALFNSKVKPKHTKWLLKGLSKDASLDLLCSNAFSCNTPKEGYEEVSKKVSKYCEGHPLALKVLGKALYNRDVDEWEDYIERLKKETDPSIKKVLQMSFDSLPSENDKELFKHIACFFVGKDGDYAETILKACNIKTRSGIKNLVDRCLLSIGWYNELRMHQLLQEMGRDEVRKESPKPWKCSRLWNHDESYEVLKKNKKDMDNILGLTLDMRFLKKEKLSGSFEVKTDVLSKMESVMLLQLNYVQIKGTYKKFPEELRWLCMHGFPLKSIPSDLALDKLVALDLSYSSIESFGMCWSNPQKVIGSCSKDKRVFGSLKILDLSFCEQLQKLGGFYKLPKLERLIASNCKRLIEVCESLGECVELVHIDLSYCVKLEKLPTAIHKLKKDYKLLLDGCNTCESILRQMVPSAISFKSSLGKLSLKNNNLSNESFPMDWSCLSGLKYLCLDGNPIDSLPNCVRSLPSLEELSMYDCYSLMSIEHPPCTLRELDFQTSYCGLRQLNIPTSHCVANKPLLHRISFHPDMSPVSIKAPLNSLRPWSYEIQGMVKIQPLEGVEKKVLCSLGWSNLDFIDKSREVVTYDYWRRPEESHIIQMYYEFGIFSTFYGGKVMPHWITSTISSLMAPISFTIPLSPRKQLRGLNFCYVIKKHGFPRNRFFRLPVINISNKTKNLTWIYEHCIDNLNVGGKWLTFVGGKWLTFISHWMFGMNEMEAGDKIIITVKDPWAFFLLTNCGVNLVYDHGSMEEDALEYYKSWNHIIGGDLSSFQLTTGEYILRHRGFTRLQYENYQYKVLLSGNSIPFRAFSKRKSPIDKPLLQRISFDSDMSPINVTLFSNSFQPWSCEIEPLKGVEEKVLCSLGWTNLDFLNLGWKMHIVTNHHMRGKEQSQIQMYYEFGIFSTIYGGQAMPVWIRFKRSRTPISFTIPSSPNKQLKGLNFCYVQRRKWYGENSPTHPYFRLPEIEISNKTKNRTWRYKHCIEDIDVEGEWLTFLSHWMFGMNEMEPGDNIIITIIDVWGYCRLTDCGVNLVYDHGSMEDDALEYYKSWNHIIGGDLSSFQSPTGEYILCHKEFTPSNENDQGLSGYTSKYIGEIDPLAFSKRKSPMSPSFRAKRQRVSASSNKSDSSYESDLASFEGAFISFQRAVFGSSSYSL